MNLLQRSNWCSKVKTTSWLLFAKRHFFYLLALCSTKEFNILIKNVREVFSALKAAG